MSTLSILSKIWYFASPSPSFLKMTESTKKLYVCWKLEETNDLDIIQSTYEMLYYLRYICFGCIERCSMQTYIFTKTGSPLLH